MKCEREKPEWKQTRYVLVLVPFLFLFFVSCGKAKDISGEYTAVYDMKEQLNQDLEAGGLPIQIEGELAAQYHLTLGSDGTFTWTLNTEKFGEDLKTTLLNEQDIIVRALLESEGVTEDMHELLVQAGGYESFEEFQSEIMEEAVAALEAEAMEELKEESSIAGNYRLEGTTITLEDDHTPATIIAEGILEKDGTIQINVTEEIGSREFLFTRNS